jgi:hypothetical protein
MSEGTLRPVRRGRSPNGNGHAGHKIKALPGGLSVERRRCSRPNCHCSEGGEALHGPYLYRRWLESGRRRRQYVKPADAEQVRAGIAEWQRLHPPARTMRDTLAELRRLCRQPEILG